MEKGSTFLSRARNLLQSGAELESILELISHEDKSEIETVYENSWNLMHYAIVNKRVDVVKHLFDIKLFLLLHKSETIPYMHVACAYGCEDIVRFLIEERPNEQNIAVSNDDQHWRKLTDELPYDDKGAELSTKTMSLVKMKKQLTAFEVAAYYNHIECLSLLLQEFPKNRWLGRLAINDQAIAVQILLMKMDMDLDALNYGFESSLGNMSPLCLEILIEYAENHNIKFSLANPYHYMFTSGKRYPESHLVECTRILIHRGFDVNMKSDPGRNPLCTLLCHATDTYIRGESLDDEIVCVSELLVAGANPNFRLDDRLKTDENKLPVMLSSVVGALMFILQRTRLDTRLLNYIAQSVTLLVEYGCDMSEANNEGKSVLQHYMMCIGCVIGSMKLDYSMLPAIGRTLGSMVNGGTDLHHRNEKNNFPVVTFIANLLPTMKWHMLNNDITEDLIHKPLQDQLKTVFHFLTLMGIEEAQEAVAESVCMIDAYEDKDIPDLMKTVLKKELHLHGASIRSLKHICSVQLWQFTGKQFPKLLDAMLPLALKTSLTGMFYPLIQGLK